jgi:predicted nuclease with TOPRIM domain
MPEQSPPAACGTRQGNEVDAEKNRLYGDTNQYLHELPAGWETKKERLEKLRAARKRLEEQERRREHDALVAEWDREYPGWRNSRTERRL